MSENSDEKSTQKQGFWASVAADAKKSAAEAEAREKLASETAGNLVTKQSFGGSTVEIYDGGYVRIATFISRSTPYERLRSIKHSFQVQDKSAGGRITAGLLTSGVSLLTSKEKRTIFLTVATDKRTHSLKATGGMGRGPDKVALSLETAGRGVLDTLAVSGPAPSTTNLPSENQVDVIGQIKELGELHAAGVLTEDEFAAKKADLLKRI